MTRPLRLPNLILALLLSLGACDCEPDPEGTGDGSVDDASNTDGASPDGAGPDGAGSDGASPDGSGIPELCGNGDLDDDEECDDGGNLPFDGCSPTCMVETGVDCYDDVCIPAACGDGIRVPPEQCDDGNPLSGDGCSARCIVEPGWVCVTENFPCRQAVCGDGAVEAQEQCDDGGNAAPGCDASCQLEPGHHCPTPGQACVATTCGNGVREGLEQCDDDNLTPGDGCSATCTIEPFYVCEGSPLSVCKKPVEFVRIARFVAPMQQPQALHYDPRTRSFVAYDFNTSDMTNDAQEFCLDGTQTNVRDAQLEARRALVGSSLDGAAYDPFRDRFLFVRQNGRIYEIDRDNNVTATIDGLMLDGLGTAGGVQVGDDGLIYATRHHDLNESGTGYGVIRVFERDEDGVPGTTSIRVIDSHTSSTYLDNIFNIPGMGWIGYYNLPNPAFPSPNEAHQGFTFHDYQGNVVGVSQIPGVLFRNGERFPHNADGGEAASDGGYFLVCSEYLTRPGDGMPMNDGICQLFAQTCTSHLDCAERVPGTICRFEDENGPIAIPYCYAAANARDDRFTVERETATSLDVLANDTFADAVCTGSAPLITAVSEGSHGGTITISGGTSVSYTSAGASGCGFVERFTYTVNLGGGVMDTAEVFVRVPCECGNNVVEPGEQCDDPDPELCTDMCTFPSLCGNNTVDPGEQCDDGNMTAGDGCSPTCTWEIVID